MFKYGNLKMLYLKHGDFLVEFFQKNPLVLQKVIFFNHQGTKFHPKETIVIKFDECFWMFYTH